LHFSYSEIYSNAKGRMEGTPVATLLLKFPVSGWSDKAVKHNPQLGNF
jgi:hypothetical protein